MNCEYPLNPLKDYICKLEATHFMIHKFDQQTYCCCKYHINPLEIWEEISKEEYEAYEVLRS